MSYVHERNNIHEKQSCGQPVLARSELYEIISCIQHVPQACYVDISSDLTAQQVIICRKKPDLSRFHDVVLSGPFSPVFSADSKLMKYGFHVSYL